MLGSDSSIRMIFIAARKSSRHLLAATRTFPLVKPPHLRPRRYTVDKVVSLIKERIQVPNLSFEVNINLNIDPYNMKHHMLQGVLEMPHTSGKRAIVAALTTDENLTVGALMAGAKYAGDIGDAIGRRKIEKPIFKRVIATTELEDALCKKGQPLARLLRKKKLTPSTIDRTLVEPKDFVEVVRKHVDGTYVKFSTSTCGVVAVTVGKIGTHTSEQIVENLESVLLQLYAMQPKDFGTGPRGKIKYRGKYVIDAHMHVKGVESFPLDLVELLQTVDKTGFYTNESGPRKLTVAADIPVQ